MSPEIVKAYLLLWRRAQHIPLHSLYGIVATGLWWIDPEIEGNWREHPSHGTSPHSWQSTLACPVTVVAGMHPMWQISNRNEEKKGQIECEPWGSIQQVVDGTQGYRFGAPWWRNDVRLLSAHPGIVRRRSSGYNYEACVRVAWIVEHPVVVAHRVEYL